MHRLANIWCNFYISIINCKSRNLIKYLKILSKKVDIFNRAGYGAAGYEPLLFFLYVSCVFSHNIVLFLIYF